VLTCESCCGVVWFADAFGCDSWVNVSSLPLVVVITAILVVVMVLKSIMVALPHVASFAKCILEV
jgi:hypothetical protein